MIYSLEPKEVRKVLDAVREGRAYDAAQFEYYHLNRNHFNVKAEVTTLKQQSGDIYIDNFGRPWELQANWKNYYHMTSWDWLKGMVSKPTARKFLLDDNVSGLGGEFEMIIRDDGKRIDALVNAAFQETYNFALTRNMLEHKKLDVNPHNLNGNYTFRQNMGSVVVTEKP